MISDGYANGGGTQREGGGAYLAGVDVLFENYVFRNNFSDFTGGAVSLRGANEPIFDSCTFEENSAVYGGAIIVMVVVCLRTVSSHITLLLFKVQRSVPRVGTGYSVDLTHCTLVHNYGGTATVYPFGGMQLLNSAL